MQEIREYLGQPGPPCEVCYQDEAAGSCNGFDVCSKECAEKASQLPRGGEEKHGTFGARKGDEDD